MLSVQTKKTDEGMALSVRKNTYHLRYPHHRWNSISASMQESLRAHLALISTMHLPLICNEHTISYNTSIPLFESLFYENMIYDIPSCTAFNSQETSEVMRQFMNIDFTFDSLDAEIPTCSYDVKDNVVIPFTFGKDSLLSFALADELHLSSTLVHIEEPAFAEEMIFKDKLAKQFHHEFKIPVERLLHKTGLLRDMNHLKVKKKEFGWGHQTTEYSILMIPYLVSEHAQLILFGNEQDNNYFVFDNEGFICYPSFDQSSRWTRQQNAMVKTLTDNRAGVSSFLEPLNDYAILKVLHHRYPHYAKYQMSCFSNHRGMRWCQECSKCARSYVNLLAAGAQTKQLGISRNMLDKKYRNYFTIFSGAKLNGFDASDVARDEQLFSFYLALKNGAKGYLMDEFRKQFWKEVVHREDELREKYYAIHTPSTIPAEFKSDILSIFKEEL